MIKQLISFDIPKKITRNSISTAKIWEKVKLQNWYQNSSRGFQSKGMCIWVIPQISASEKIKFQFPNVLPYLNCVIKMSIFVTFQPGNKEVPQNLKFWSKKKKVFHIFNFNRKMVGVLVDLVNERKTQLNPPRLAIDLSPVPMWLGFNDYYLHTYRVGQQFEWLFLTFVILILTQHCDFYLDGCMGAWAAGRFWH